MARLDRGTCFGMGVKSEGGVWKDETFALMDSDLLKGLIVVFLI